MPVENTRQVCQEKRQAVTVAMSEYGLAQKMLNKNYLCQIAMPYYKHLELNNLRLLRVRLASGGCHWCRSVRSYQVLNHRFPPAFP